MISKTWYVVIVILKCVQAAYNHALFYVCPGFVCVCVGGWVGGTSTVNFKVKNYLYTFYFNMNNLLVLKLQLSCSFVDV